MFERENAEIVARLESFMEWCADHPDATYPMRMVLTDLQRVLTGQIPRKHYVVCVVPISYGHTPGGQKIIHAHEAVCLCGDRRRSVTRDIAIRLNQYHCDQEAT